MGTAENKQLVQHAFSEMEKGNSKPFVDSLADGVRWTVIGTTAWSGTYDGKQAVLTRLLGPLSSQLEGRFRLTVLRFIAEGDHVVVEARGRNTTKKGLPYDNTYCWVCRIAEGRIQELTEYADTALVAAVLEAPG